MFLSRTVLSPESSGRGHLLPCAMMWTCTTCGSDVVTRTDITVLPVVLFCEDCHARFTFIRERCSATERANCALVGTVGNERAANPLAPTAPQWANAIEDTARLLDYLRSGALSTQHQLDSARALVKSTRELIKRLEAEKFARPPRPSSRLPDHLSRLLPHIA